MTDVNNLAIAISAIHQNLTAEDFTIPTEAESFTAFQWANVFESMSNEQRLRIWPALNRDLKAATLNEMREDARNQFVSVLPEKDVFTAIKSGDNAASISIIDVLPTKTVKKLVNKLNPIRQSQIESSMAYTEHQVGRYANLENYTIVDSATVQSALDEIKQTSEISNTAIFWVVNEDNGLSGEVSFNELISQRSEAAIRDVCNPVAVSIGDKASLLEASNIARGSTKPQLPVVDENGTFIGTFSQHDALTVFQEHYEAQIAHLGKVSDEDLFAPIGISARRRAVWLGINLLTAFIASFVIGLFDKVLVEVVALAVLMPIVASMGGITGSQTLTLTIRGIATGHLVDSNFGLLRNKEVIVAVINGLLWAVVVAIATAYWFDNYLLSAILAVAMIVNMAVASLAGLFIPKILSKVGVDPALAGSVILTTVTDVVGFFVFLGGATVLFLS